MRFDEPLDVAVSQQTLWWYHMTMFVYLCVLKCYKSVNTQMRTINFLYVCMDVYVCVSKFCG